MDDSDVYICFPGEIVVYFPFDKDDQSAGLLCTVKGLKKGKVELAVHSSANSRNSMLTNPSDFVESGEYGSDQFDTKDELGEICDSYDTEGEEMDQDVHTYSEQHIEPPSQKQEIPTERVDVESAISQYVVRNYDSSFETLRNLPDGTKTLLFRGKCMQQCGDHEQALHFLLQAARTTEYSNSYVPCCIAESYIHLGVSKEVWAWCERALQADPKSPYPRYLAARLLFLEPEYRRPECMEQLKMSILHCHVTEGDQPLSECISMWNDIARMAQSLEVELSLCLRAYMRSIGVARSLGALSSPSSHSNIHHLRSPLRVAEVMAARQPTCDALYGLGQLLESQAPIVIPAVAGLTGVGGWETISKAGESEKKRRQLKSATVFATKRAAAAAPLPVVPVGRGYLQGALAAYRICNGLSQNSVITYTAAEAGVQARLLQMN